MRRWTAFWSLFGIWIVGSFLLFSQIEFKTDANIFIPRFASSDTRLVTEQLRRGPASNILLLAISGAPKELLTLASDRLAARLRAKTTYSFIANGRLVRDDATVAWVLRYRYLLEPPVTGAEFTTASLRAAFTEILGNLATSAGVATEELMFLDPTGRMSRILEHFSRQDAPNSNAGVWLSADGTMALLVARPRSEAFDLDGQAAAIATIRSQFAQTLDQFRGSGTPAPALRLLISGPGVFAVLVREQIVSEMAWIGALTSGCFLLIVLYAFRSGTILALLSFVVGVGLTAGVLAVWAIFGEVHGITITFGMMLAGLAIDYPMHVIVHGAKGGPGRERSTPIWPTLQLSVLTTVAAFVPFTVSSFPGLAQLGVISIVGILATYLMTRVTLPMMLRPGLVARMPMRRRGWPRPSRKTMTLAKLACAVTAGAAASWFALGGGKVWEDSLASLSPLSRDQLTLDLQLRRIVQAVNPRFLLLVTDTDRDEVLRRSERISANLARLVEQGRLAGFDAPSQYLPTRQAQLDRQSTLPPAESLAKRVSDALVGTPFQQNAFDGFVRDVARSRDADRLVTYESMLSSIFGIRLSTLLFSHEGRWVGLIVFRGEALPVEEIGRSAAIASVGARLVDLRAEADNLLVNYRLEATFWLGLGALLSLIALAIGLRDARLVARIFAPVVLAVLLTGTIVLCLGIPLSLFHLMALSVVAGLGYDYALFLDKLRGADVLDEVTLHAVVLCAIVTAADYAILSFSSLPVLHGIGLTVAIGCVFVLALTTLFSLEVKRENG